MFGLPALGSSSHGRDILKGHLAFAPVLPVVQAGVSNSQPPGPVIVMCR